MWGAGKYVTNAACSGFVAAASAARLRVLGLLSDACTVFPGSPCAELAFRPDMYLELREVCSSASVLLPLYKKCFGCRTAK